MRFGSVWKAGTLAAACVLTTTCAMAGDESSASKAAMPKDEALAYYEQCVDLYLRKGDLETLDEQLQRRRLHLRHLSRDQRMDLIYIAKACEGHRPSWWSKVKSTRPISFKAEIWNRRFIANYKPDRALGAQVPVGIDNGKLLIVVVWHPQRVDSNKPLDETLKAILGQKQVERHDIRWGDVAECIVWHELGHNYISEFLPLNHVHELYREHLPMYMALQEFYADMTALYHSSPKARRVQLFIRTRGIREGHVADPHTRGGHAVGSLWLSNILANPQTVKKRWPTVHLPAELDKDNAEIEAITYLYDHFDPDWTLEEDKQLREYLKRFLMTKKRGSRYTQGEAVLRDRGTVTLPNGLEFKLLPFQDGQWQDKRNAWVYQQLRRAAEAGQTDKPKARDAK